ncbi:MAG TPA: hypothetical protein VGO11_10720 [Chthoniobacteraceae bacterium]|jgi:hypothetical protein|nr:hypothetical protein [Chthoniobacteraceae bacterium]
MTELEQLLRKIRESKLAWRRHVAALPVGEKLRMLEEMIADTRAIVATHSPKPANLVRQRPE